MIIFIIRMLRLIFTVQLFFLTFFLFGQEKTAELKPKNDLLISYLFASEQLNAIKIKQKIISKSKNKIEQSALLNDIYIISKENILISKKLIDFMRIYHSNSDIVKVQTSCVSLLNQGNKILVSINNLIYDKNKRWNDKEKNKILCDSIKKLNEINDKLSTLDYQVKKISFNSNVIKSFSEVN